ncbi:MAG: pyridoxine 5'-phosphate synthase [Pseudomonadota bacterium]
MGRPIFLGVNVDHVATLRQARGTRYPCPVHAALVAEQAGADGITMHLREDRRHIQDVDIDRMAELTQTKLNFEMAATEEMVGIALRTEPVDVCLVPERREELTTEGGLDVVRNRNYLTDCCGRLAEAGIRVSLFIDPEPAQIEASAAVGAPVVELHTGAYAEAGTAMADELARLTSAARAADELGLIVNAGHGLNRNNVAPIARIPEIHELNIGHALIADAVFTGLTVAVRDIKHAMLTARASV